MDIISINRLLSEAVDNLQFSLPVTHVYNPLVYARIPYEEYLTRYGSGRREILLVGMNPGPFGMAQTGIPFGDTSMVRDWLGIEGPVGHPDHENPRRPIDGFSCRRHEVSGTRLWGWAREHWGTPERFFERFFVANYCPLVFLEESGRNRTPDKLPVTEREQLFTACDNAIKQIVQELMPRFVIGVGGFAFKRLQHALADSASLTVAQMLHPSPANPKANKGWAHQVDMTLSELGIY